MDNIENGKRSPEDKEKFSEILRKLRRDIIKFDAEVITDRIVILDRLSPLIASLEDGYKKAAETPTLDDDKLVAGFQDQLMAAFKKKVDGLDAGLAQPDPANKSLLAFINARIRLASATTVPENKQKYAEPHHKAITDAFEEMEKTAAALKLAGL